MTEPTQQPTLLSVDGRLVGTDAALRTVQQTQSTPGLNPNFSSGSFGTFSPNITSGTGIAQPFQNAGVGSRGDDNTGLTQNATERMVNAQSNYFVNAQPNILDNYASYTYSLSWYLLTSEQYKVFVTQTRPSTTSWSLLAQSGGAPQGTNSAGGGRNPYFGLDFYLDNLVIENQLVGKATSSVHSVTNISFTVTEPSGITLVKKMREAVIDNIKNEQKSNPDNKNSKAPNLMTEKLDPTAATYCMVINFYGYDENGNLVSVGKSSTGAPLVPGVTDTRAIVQKYITFQISDIKFKLQSKGSIEYKITAQPVYQAQNISTNRGTIPYNFSLNGETLGQVLNGNPVTNSATSKATEGRVDKPNPPSARDAAASSALSGGSYDPITGMPTYATGA